MLSAPAGSGKTVLLRSWVGEAGLAKRAAWVSVHGEDRDPQRFLLSLADALRETVTGSELVRPLTATPDLDGWAIVEGLLHDLHSLPDRIWLVVDDLHELHSDRALRQLELLVMRAPAQLRFVFASRRDLQLGLHRLRLDGELTEIRAADLRFTLEESRDLLDAAGVRLSEQALTLLHERTEGWAAGLRLAALSLAGHPDPDLFAAGFSGSERTVAEYLLAEVLGRQPKQVRRLLVRTSVLERVNGELADLLTGGSGGGKILHDLEQANAFVIALDAQRSWFHYHALFADLLQLELLDTTAQDELARLHGAAAAWFGEHGFPVEAVRHAQAAQDWDLAGRLLSDHWFGLALDGKAATADDLLCGFPHDVIAADPELTILLAARELNQGALADAERHLQLAAEGSESVAAARRGHLQIALGMQRLNLARLRGDLPVAIEEARRLLTPAGTPGPAEELRAMALLSLGATEWRTGRLEEAERHLEQARALAVRVGRPYLEFASLVFGARAVTARSFALVTEFSMQAIQLAERHGWTDDPLTGDAYLILGAALVWRGRLEEAEPWIQRAERAVRAETEPAATLGLHYVRAHVELARGRAADALASFRAAERQAERLVGAAPARHPGPRGAAANPGPDGRGRTRRADPRRARRQGTRNRGDARGPGGAAAGPGRPAGGGPGPGARPRRLRPGPPPGLAERGVRAGSGRARRARRLRRRRASPGTRAGYRRARRRGPAVPAASRSGAARAPSPAPHRARLADRRDHEPARRREPIPRAGRG